MTYRMIQWGTGNVGNHALRTIVERPDFELVGVRVYNPEKVGKDAGELLGIDPVGVIATDDVDAIVALDADCVSYTPLGTTLDNYDQPLDDICRLLESGKNVVSSAVEYHAYLHPDVAPQRAGIAAIERLNAACVAGNTQLLSRWHQSRLHDGRVADHDVAGVPDDRAAQGRGAGRHEELLVAADRSRRHRVWNAARSRDPRSTISSPT